MGTVSELANRARYIHRREGTLSLIKRGARFVLSCLFLHKVYDVCERRVADVRGWDRAEYMPKVTDCEFRIVSTNEEADELENTGLEFRSQVFNSRKALKAGAIANCVFVRKNLANIAWICSSRQALRCLGDPPIKASFEKDEAVLTGDLTLPEYRNMNIASYSRLRRYQFLDSKGIAIATIFIDRANKVGHVYQKKTELKLVGIGRHLRILGIDFWWQKQPQKAP